MLDDIESMINSGGISFTDGFSAPLDEFMAMWETEADIYWNTIVDKNISQEELNELFLEHENENTDNQATSDAEGNGSIGENGQEPVAGNEGNQPEVEETVNISEEENKKLPENEIQQPINQQEEEKTVSESEQKLSTSDNEPPRFKNPKTVRELADLEAGEREGLISGVVFSTLKEGDVLKVGRDKTYTVTRKTKPSKQTYVTKDGKTGTYERSTITITDNNGNKVSADLWDNWYVDGKKYVSRWSDKGQTQNKDPWGALSRDIEGDINLDLINEYNQFHDKSDSYNRIQDYLNSIQEETPAIDNEIAAQNPNQPAIDKLKSEIKGLQNDIKRKEKEINERNSVFGDIKTIGEKLGTQPFDVNNAKRVIEGYKAEISRKEKEIETLTKAGETGAKEAAAQQELVIPATTKVSPLEKKLALAEQMKKERKDRILSEGTNFDKPFHLIPVNEIKTADDILANAEKIISLLDMCLTITLSIGINFQTIFSRTQKNTLINWLCIQNFGKK